jgi:hypothetical protein
MYARARDEQAGRARTERAAADTVRAAGRGYGAEPGRLDGLPGFPAH